MEFTLATCNVLYEPYYVHYVEPGNVLISVGWRSRAFKHALHDSDALGSKDILCFQEWPYKARMLHAHKNQIVLVNGLKEEKKGAYVDQFQDRQPKEFNEYLREAYSEQRYAYIIDEHAQADGVMCVINKSKFNVIDIEFRLFEKTKKMVMVLLNYHNSSKRLLLVNAHLPLFDQEKYIKQMVKAAQHWHRADHVIVCGDFNYDIWKQASAEPSDYKIKKLLSHFDQMKASVQNLKLPTAVSGLGNEYRLVDYILYSQTLKMTKIEQFPPLKPIDKSILIKHEGQEGSVRAYFSDHAILRATFKTQF